MAELLFGTAGVPLSSEQPSTVSGIARIRELGLGGMELEFVQGVRMSEATASEVAAAARENGVRLSAHGPYFMNFNSHEPAKIEASKERLLKTARIAALCGARSAIFHPAFYMGDPSDKVYRTVKQHLAEVLGQLKSEGNPIRLRPEVTGKPSQFGTVEEILGLCAELEGLAPCIDFSHWHARTGRFNSYPEFASVIAQVKDKLGQEYLEDMHLHVSGINYGKKGELNHMNLRESDLAYPELLRALKDYGAGGLVICESPNLEDDARLLKETYNSLS